MSARITNSWNNEIIWQHKKIVDTTKNGEKVPSLVVVEVVLVQCKLIDNQYKPTSEVLYTFMPNKSHTYLLNIEPSNLVLLKTYNIEFDEIIITFTDENVRPSEIVNLTLLINKQKLRDILQNQEQKNMLKDMDFYHLHENIKKKLIDTGLDASKKVAYKASEPLGNNIEKQESVEEIIISLEKRQETIKKSKKSI